MKTIIKSNIPHPQYFELVQNLYENSSETRRYISDSREGYAVVKENKSIPAVFFHLFENNNLIGHLGLINISFDEACFGFFELKNPLYFHDLWQALLAEAKLLGLKKLFGPVNGTVWHPYRLISESSNEPFFVHEPLSSPGYFNLFKGCSPAHIIEYYSAYRTNFNAIIELTRQSLNLHNHEGIKIIQKDLSSDLLKEIYDLSVTIFASNPGYVNLTYSDFVKLYSDYESKESEVIIFMVLHDNKPIGFSYNILVREILIMKTIGLIPEWQEKGIGYILVHAVHNYARDNQVQKVIYALIRSENRVKHFPKDDAVIFRKYAALIYSLS